MLGILSIKPREKVMALIPSFLICCAIFFPSSIGGQISTSLPVLHLVVLFCLCLFLMVTQNVADPLSYALSLSIVAILLASSLLSQLRIYKPGGAIGFVCFAALCCTSLIEMRVAPRLLLAINLFNLVAGVGMVVGIGPIVEFIRTYYSAYYPELVDWMILSHKPVSTFGTHSLAAMGYFLFFDLNLKTYKARRRGAFLLSAILYILLAFALASVSGLMLGSIMIARMGWMALRSNWRTRLLMLILVIAALVWAPWDEIGSLSMSILSSQGNGFLGRYSENGELIQVVSYVLHHPFSPTGVTYSPHLELIDSGILYYLLHGSVLLIVCMYGALYRFLRRNLLVRNDAIWLAVIVIAFELGFNVLTQARMMYLLAFVIVYTNELQRSGGSFAETRAPAQESGIVALRKSSVALVRPNSSSLQE